MQYEDNLYVYFLPAFFKAASAVFTKYTTLINLPDNQEKQSITPYDNVTRQIPAIKGSTHTGLRSGLKTSPWIILGSTVILLIAVIVFAVQNSHREKKYMSQLMSTKGAALIRAVEAGARAGMMGMMWGGQQIQRLLEETGRLPDVLYMAVVEENGIVVAHSDPSKINTPFRQNKKLIHLGPDLKENWELVDLVAGRRSFEVHRHFRPLASGRVGAKTGNAGHLAGCASLCPPLRQTPSHL